MKTNVILSFIDGTLIHAKGNPRSWKLQGLSCIQSLLSPLGIGVDFVGPLSPPWPSGNRYILTHRLLKICMCKSIAFKGSRRGSKCFEGLFFTFGIPAVITTDQGTQFNVYPAELKSLIQARFPQDLQDRPDPSMLCIAVNNFLSDPLI